MDTDAKIVIVGAGIAGISAAGELLKAEFKNVKILEASDRKGGRIYTNSFGKYNGNNAIVELGANWIHGMGAKNSVFSFADSANLLKPYIFLDRYSGYFYTEDGRQIDRSLSEKVIEILQKAEADADKFLTEATDDSKNCQQYLVERLHEILESFESSEKEDVKAIFSCFMNYMGFHTGDDMDKVSLKYYGQFEDIEGGNVKIPGGFTGVVDTLAKSIPKELIDYEVKATSIQLHVDTSGITPIHYVKLICDANNETNSRVYEADHVIYTCSLGVLKEHHTSLFQPQLPLDKQKAIKNLGFGTVNKIFLEYEKPFWRFGEGGIKFAWQYDEMIDESRDTWYRRIFAFDEVLYNDNVLVGWIHGHSAEFMETLSDEEIKTTCTDLIRKFKNDKNIPEPLRIVRSKWKSNPHTHGSYSYIATGSTNEDIAALAKPILIDDKPLLMFAGEATHEKYFSTTHGARSTGLREAKRLINFYSK